MREKKRKRKRNRESNNSDDIMTAKIVIWNSGWERERVKIYIYIERSVLLNAG